MIGAGIVGVSAAVWLQREGHDVVLVDRGEPGEGTSYGNGGVLASCGIVPVTVPGLLGKAPRLFRGAVAEIAPEPGRKPRKMPPFHE